jgi:endogenous inhibitor of DNA gyrase (YacG/DUF329 family)
MSPAATGARMVRCPGCGGPSVYSTDNAFRPFCSARCKNNDFGAWASEGYAVPADPDPDLPDPDAEPDGARPH